MVFMRQRRDFFDFCKKISIDDVMAETFYNNHFKNINLIYKNIKNYWVIKNFSPHFKKVIIINTIEISNYDFYTYLKLLNLIFSIKKIFKSQIFLTYGNNSIYYSNPENYCILSNILNMKFERTTITKCESIYLTKLFLKLYIKNVKTVNDISMYVNLLKLLRKISSFYPKFTNIINNKFKFQAGIKQYFLIRNNLMVIMEQSAISPIKNNKHNHSYWYCLEDYVFSNEYIMSKIMKYV